MSTLGLDDDNVGDVSLGAKSVPASTPVHVPSSFSFLSEDQFQRSMAAQRPSVLIPEPSAFRVVRLTHALSD